MNSSSFVLPPLSVQEESLRPQERGAQWPELSAQTIASIKRMVDGPMKRPTPRFKN